MGDIAFNCASCGQPLEAPEDMEGDSIECPSCKVTMDVPQRFSFPKIKIAPPPLHPPMPVPTANPKTEPIHQAILKTRPSTSGVGFGIQFVGFCLIFVWPIGTIIGIGLLVVGGSMSRKLVCGECGNKVDSHDVKMCPTCKARFVF